VTVFQWIIFITIIALLPLSMWWCLRQYYRARRKGYYPMLAATVVFGGALLTVIAGLIVLDAFWYGRTTSVVLLLFPVPALVVTVLVALLPRRPRRVGPRRSSFLSSRVPRVGLLVASFAAFVVILPVFVATGGYVIGIWPQSELVKLGEKLPGGIFVMLGFSLAALAFARERLGAPGLADTVATDTRPPVLYLRAFQQESNPFVWVAPQERSRYTQRTYSPPTVTFEKYLGAEFTRQLGPFVALGNPLDWLPPEGAARSYAPDEDWQRHFLTLAGAATAIVMDGSHSDNLHWELAEITRNGWQRKLFLLTTPVPQERGGGLWSAALRSAKGVWIPRWEQLAAELTQAGLHVPPTKPDSGSVLAFDAAGRAEVLIHSAQQPEEFVTAVRTHL
jgi:hypothetical protein